MADDAIVMLENIVRHIERGEKPLDAALRGSREISFTILSMTLSLAAIFIPVIFMPGLVGRLLREFSMTIAFAILISGGVSPLTAIHLVSPVFRSIAVTRLYGGFRTGSPFTRVEPPPPPT